MNNLLKYMSILAVCVATSTSASAESVLRIGLNDEPDGLDPTFSRAYVGRIVLGALCDKLFDISPDGKVVPQLATKYEWADDKKSVTLDLRPGVKFHDGTPVNAEAVKFTLERYKNTPGSFRRTEINDVQSIDVLSETQLRLNLDEPYAPLITALTANSGFIISPTAVEKEGDKFAANPVCAGPFKFESRVAQGKITLTRNAEYWDKDNIHYDKVEFLPISDSTVRISNLRAGELDILERVSPSDLAQLRTDPNIRVADVPGYGYYSIRFNINNDKKSALFGKNPALREAIDVAIDRKTIVDVVFNNEFKPGNQAFSPGSFYYNAELPMQNGDPAKAAEILTKAGISAPEFTLLAPAERDRQEAAQVVQAMLLSAGINMSIETQENVTMLKNASEGNFQAYISYFSGRLDPDEHIEPYFSCAGPRNDQRYCNEDFDALLAEGRATSEPNDRKQFYDKAVAKLVEDRPALPLWHPVLFFGHNAKIEGFKPYPDGVVRFSGLKDK